MSETVRLLKALESAKGIEIDRGEAIADIKAFAALVKPHFGKIEWTPPKSYVSVLESWGPFSARRHVASIDSEVGFALLGEDDIGGVNEDLVHMPEGVSRDEGVDLTTNHLVGFAEADGEAVWCFDVTQGKDGEYPVYYHHQDEPRARILESGAWDEPADGKPDFESFTQWLETMTAALVSKKPPKWFEDLGTPGMTFVKKRLKVEST